MVILLLAVIGLAFGSFVNALVWRLHESRDWIRERSECPHCHHILAVEDLIPVVSWLLLAGRCRYCKAKIDDSPLVELAVPALFVASYIWRPVALDSGAAIFEFGLWLVFLVGFVALAVYDLRWLLLPNVIVFPLMGLAVLQVLSSWLASGGSAREVLSAALGVAVISGLFYLIFTISHGKWVGFGDVKLGVILGLLAGSPARAALLLFVASLLGTLVALPMVVSGKANRKSLLPFGPLLIIGLVVVQLWGGDIIDWYTGLLVVS